jgi:hypothetical protein
MRCIRHALIVAAGLAAAACIAVPRGLAAEPDHAANAENVLWMSVAILAVLVIAAAAKSTVERWTLHGLRRRRKARLLREIERRLAAEAARG